MRAERMRMMGEALRRSYVAPKDTMITGDMPLLLTLLSRLPAAPSVDDGRASFTDAVPR